MCHVQPLLSSCRVGWSSARPRLEKFASKYIPTPDLLTPRFYLFHFSLTFTCPIFTTRRCPSNLQNSTRTIAITAFHSLTNEPVTYANPPKPSHFPKFWDAPKDPRPDPDKLFSQHERILSAQISWVCLPAKEDVLNDRNKVRKSNLNGLEPSSSNWFLQTGVSVPKNGWGKRGTQKWPRIFLRWILGPRNE